MSNEKEAPGCLGYIGDEILPRIRIPINQPGFNGKSSVFFFRSSGVIHTVDGSEIPNNHLRYINLGNNVIN